MTKATISSPMVHSSGRGSHPPPSPGEERVELAVALVDADVNAAGDERVAEPDSTPVEALTRSQVPGSPRRFTS
jgi:hypothetical protein